MSFTEIQMSFTEILHSAIKTINGVNNENCHEKLDDIEQYLINALNAVHPHTDYAVGYGVYKYIEMQLIKLKKNQTTTTIEELPCLYGNTLSLCANPDHLDDVILYDYGHEEKEIEHKIAYIYPCSTINNFPEEYMEFEVTIGFDPYVILEKNKSNKYAAHKRYNYMKTEFMFKNIEKMKTVKRCDKKVRVDECYTEVYNLLKNKFATVFPFDKVFAPMKNAKLRCNLEFHDFEIKFKISKNDLENEMGNVKIAVEVPIPSSIGRHHPMNCNDNIEKFCIYDNGARICLNRNTGHFEVEHEGVLQHSVQCMMNILKGAAVKYIPKIPSDEDMQETM